MVNLIRRQVVRGTGYYSTRTGYPGKLKKLQNSKKIEKILVLLEYIIIYLYYISNIYIILI